MNEKLRILQKIKVAFVVLILILATTLVLSACGENQKVNFYVDGKVYSTSTIDNSGISEIPSKPKKVNYQFSGWYFDKEFETIFKNSDSLKDFEGDINLYAKFVALPNDFHIQITGFDKLEDFRYEINVSKDKTTFNFNEYITTSNDFTWVLTDRLSNTVGLDSNNVALEMGLNTFYGIFTPKGGTPTNFTFMINKGATLNVLFDTKGGTPKIQSVQVEYGSKINAPTQIISKDYYSFDGWDYDFNQSITRNTTINAKWVPVKFNIIYHLNGATNSEENPTQYTIESEIVLRDAVFNDGRVFDAWYDAEVNGNEISRIVRGTTGELNLYARPIEQNLGLSLTITTTGEKIADPIDEDTVWVKYSTERKSSFNEINNDNFGIAVGTKLTGVGSATINNITSGTIYYIYLKNYVDTDNEYAYDFGIVYKNGSAITSNYNYFDGCYGWYVYSIEMDSNITITTLYDDLSTSGQTPDNNQNNTFTITLNKSSHILGNVCYSKTQYSTFDEVRNSATNLTNGTQVNAGTYYIYCYEYFIEGVEGDLFNYLKQDDRTLSQIKCLRDGDLSYYVFSVTINANTTLYVNWDVYCG